MWEKENAKGRQIEQISTWSMVFSFTLAFTTCFIDSLSGYLANLEFTPDLRYNSKDVFIPISVAMASVVWVVMLKKFPSS